MAATGRCRRSPGPALVRAAAASSDLSIPDPDYVVTLDADSVLLPEYCLRLVHLLEQSEYRDMAIAQTPYSAFPGSATRLERIAGATTDLQHIVHQGLTYYDATFWVGANAVIRKRALDDIAETSYIGDWEIRHYIRDRTVIEDTESTIDMGIHGWRLFNCPERLSYSATPPDFGSLCIQRRRWANGGLLIMPKLRRQSRARRAQGQRTRFSELFLRWNYMASICWSSASLLVLLAFPFSATLISPLLGLVALPYFLAMASDLRYCGYKRLDVLRIYGFNLVLLPVNLAGTISSVVQGITASKAPFARTPKVRNRTVVPPFFVIAPYLLIALAGVTFYFAYRHDRVENMAYAGAQHRAGLLRRQGLHRAAQLRGGRLHPRLLAAVQVRQRSAARLRRKARTDQQAPRPADWRSVLEVGFVEGRTTGPGPTPAQCHDRPPRRRPPAQPPAAEPRRRLSLLRLVLVASPSLAGIGYGGLHRRSGPGCSLPSRHPPDLVRALRRRHAHADLPVPERLGRPGPADGPGVRGRRARIRVRAELGRRLQPGPGQSVAGDELTHRPGAAGRGAGHRLVRRPGPHQPRRGLHQRSQPHRGLPVGDQRLPPDHDRSGHRGRRAEQLPAPSSAARPPMANLEQRCTGSASQARCLADPAGRAVTGCRATRSR